MRLINRIIRTGMIIALLGFVLAGCTMVERWDHSNRSGRAWTDEVARPPGSHFTDQWGHAGVNPWDP